MKYKYLRAERQPGELHVFCQNHQVMHYLIDKGQPAQNETVEHSHYEDEYKFYRKHTFKSLRDLKEKIVSWNVYHNNLEHCSLEGKTPNEVLLGK